jgi:hypothetical protein
VHREVVAALRQTESAPRARRRGSASRTRGTCSGAACPRPRRRMRCSMETSIRSDTNLRV